MHRRAGVDNKFSFLNFKISCRQAPLFRNWEECCSFLLLECKYTFGLLLPLSAPEADPQILERWDCADEAHLGKNTRAKDFGLEFKRDVQ